MTRSCWQMELSQIYLRGHLLLQTTFPSCSCPLPPVRGGRRFVGTPDPTSAVPCRLFAGEQHLLPRVLWVSASSLSFFGVPPTSLDLVGTQ